MNIMKIYKYLLGVAFAGALFASCEKEMGAQIPSDATAPELTGPTDGTTIVMTKLEEEKEIEFTFNEAVMDMNVATQDAAYKIEIDNVDGNFEYSKVVAAGSTSPIKISYSDFNRALLAIGVPTDTPTEFKFRVVYANALSSEPIKMTISTYFDVDPWGIIGSATEKGWGANTFFTSYDQETKEYSITLDLKTGDIKFRQPKFDASNPWKMNFGYDADAEGDLQLGEGNWNNLDYDGPNISLKSGNYTIKFKYVNETTAQAMIIQNSAGSETNWDGVILDAVGDGVSADNADAIPDPSGWTWGNKLLADNSGAPTANGAVYTWVWEGVTLEAAKGFKVRTENGEAPANGNGAQFDLGYGALDVDNSSANVVDDGGNLSVSVKGEYTITLVIDAANGDAKTLTIEEYSSYPTNMYLIGDHNGWDWGTAPEMIPVHSNPDKFWRILYFEAGKGFKFNSNKAWDGGEKGATGSSNDGSLGPKDFGGDNINTPSTSGYYMVVVDVTKQQVLINEVQIYMMGETVGGWDGGVAANKFTVDNDNKTVDFTGDLSSGKLRMYVAASFNDENWLGDWWQSEFMVINDVIEYRGVGGDQTAVNVGAGNYTISLNFTDDTGSVTQN
jgi:starch-binding outer membrane protein SusE/F